MVSPNKNKVKRPLEEDDKSTEFNLFLADNGIHHPHHHHHHLIIILITIITIITKALNDFTLGQIEMEWVIIIININTTLILINIIIIVNLSSLKESFSMEQKLFDTYVIPHVLEKVNSPYFATSPRPWDFYEIRALVNKLSEDEIENYEKKILQHKKRKL